jgi:hypothetical protein
MINMKSIHSIVILDAFTGRRVFARYYAEEPALTQFDQERLEASLHNRTKADVESEVFLFDRHSVVVCKKECDVVFYVQTHDTENEVSARVVLDVIYDVIKWRLNGAVVDKRALLEHFREVALIVDETVDKGIVLETDAQLIASRACFPPPPAGGSK